MTCGWKQKKIICIHEAKGDCHHYFNADGVTCYAKGCYKTEEDVKQEENIKRESRRIPITVQREVWRRDQGKCVECGSRELLEYDHIIPYSKGGSNTVRNIELLCQLCNRKKSNKI